MLTKIDIYASIIILGLISLLVDLVPEGTIRPVVSSSALTWFIRFIYYWNLQFL